MLFNPRPGCRPGPGRVSRSSACACGAAVRGRGRAWRPACRSRAAVAGLQHAGDLGVGNDLGAAVEGQDHDVLLAKTRIGDGLADEIETRRDGQLGHAVTLAHGQALADVQVGKVDLVANVIDDRAGHVQSGAPFDALQARRRIDLHDLRAVVALEHVDAGDAQAQDLGGADGALLVGRIQYHLFRLAAAVDVAAELVALGHAAHGGHDPVADDEGADVLALALGDELLHQHVLAGALQRLDDGLGDLVGVGQDHADALGALEDLDDHRGAADPLDGRQHVLAVPHEGRVRGCRCRGG